MALTKGNVLVTGASTGIGKACALHLCELGMRVFAGVRKEEDGQDLHDAACGRLEAVILDVTREEHIAAAVEKIEGETGVEGLQGIVNNAGIAVAGPLEYLPIAKFRWQMEVNVSAQVGVTQAFLPLLRRGAGRIVFMGSTSGFFAVPFVGAYGASKYALEGLADSWRAELRPFGLHVALIQPGAIATPIWDKSRDHAQKLKSQFPAEVEERYGKRLDALRKEVDRTAATATPPERVAECVAHALTAKRPKVRYRVGKTARLQYFISRWVPDRLRDALLEKMLVV